MQAPFRYADMTEYASAEPTISAQDIRNNPPYLHPLSLRKARQRTQCSLSHARAFAAHSFQRGSV